MSETAVPSNASRFWTAIVAGDALAAKEAGDSLNAVPRVAAPTFEFPEDSPSSRASATTGAAAVASAAAAGESLVSSPRMVEPDTPGTTLSAWNNGTKVGVMVINKSLVCGARTVTEGANDFMACALSPTACTTFTHKGRDGSGKPTIYLNLPLDDSSVFVIRVRASSQSVSQRVFSRPLLPFTLFPVDFRDEVRLRILTSLKFPARVWKVLFEGHEGYDWMEDLGYARGRDTRPAPVEIPSPRVGAGGYRASDFEDPLSDDEEVEAEESKTPATFVPPRGGESLRIDSLGSSDAEPPTRVSTLPTFARRVPSGEQGGRERSYRERAGSSTFRTWSPTRFADETISVARSADFHHIQSLQSKMDKLKGRVSTLEGELRSRDEILRDSFTDMRRELDALWDAARNSPRRMETVTLPTPSVTHQPPPPTMEDIIARISTDVSFRQVFLRLILVDLDKAKFVTLSDLDAKLATLAVAPPPPAAVTMTDLSGVTTRLANLETEMFKPEGVVAGLRKRVKFLEDRRNITAVDRGNKIFKDQRAVDALVVASGDRALYRYCLDFVSLITLAPDQFFSVSEGMTSEAAAVKANYGSLLEARISLSYKITYPENIMKPSDKAIASATEGWLWSASWGSHDSFEGSFNNGAYDRLKSDLKDTRDSIQNAIDFAFPIDVHGTTHAIFTEQLSLSYDQATGWLMSLTPLFKTMKIGGLSHTEAWSRVLVYTKSLLEDIKSVRALSAEKDCAAMIWGSFRTAELLKEYTCLRWVQHPQVSSILALTSMQREGKALTDAVATMGTQATTLKKHTTDLKQVQDDYKQLKRSNPSLK